MFRNRQAQAMVELLLLMVIMIPLTSMLISKTKTELLPKITNWMQREFQAQVRYGYSADEINAQSPENYASIEGPVPQKYTKTNKAEFHPLQNVHAGWTH